MPEPFIEVALHWAGAGLYVVAVVLVTYAVVFARARALTWSFAAAGLGLVPHAVAIALRWAAVGHGPYHTRFEILTSLGWMTMGILLVVLLRRRAWAALAVVGFPLVLLTEGFALFSGPSAPAMPEALRSVWLVYHVLFANFAAAAFLVSASSGLFTVLRLRPRPAKWLDRTPSVAVLDALAIRAAGLGFIFWTVTIAAGSIWGNELWGRYWGWDPMETWSLVSWLIYGSFLHARVLLNLRPVPTAWFALGSFVLFVVAYLVIPIFVNSIHNVAYV